MDIHRLEVFCKVLELQSFTKAAEAVCLTQPTISEHIRALEQTVGERLVDRLGREVLPTPSGKILYRYAKDLIALRNEALQALDKHKGALSGNLLIGASTIPGTYILPELIGTFKSLYPSIHTTLRIGGSADVVERVLEGRLEIGLIGAKWDDRRIAMEEIFSDELVLAVHAEHRWVQKMSVEPEELLSEPFILRERGSGTRIVMSQAFEAAGFPSSRLHVVAEMGSTEAVRQGIKARIGVSILSSRAVAQDIAQGTLVALPVKGLRLQRSFYLVQRKHRQLSPLCTAFIAHLHKSATATGSEGT